MQQANVRSKMNAFFHLPEKNLKAVLDPSSVDENNLSDDEEEVDAEEDLSKILGDGKQSKQTPPKPNSKPGKLIDSSVLEAQIAESLKDVDHDKEDLDVDEGQLKAELQELVGGNGPPEHSPSNQPQVAVDSTQLSLLTERKKRYEIAISNAQAAGESAKIRRLQRLNKTLNELLVKVKAGKKIDEADIPPQVGVGDPIDAAIQVAAMQNSAPPPVLTNQNLRKSLPKKCESKNDVVETLLQRQETFKKAAIAAKNADNKEEAKKYVRIMKQLDTMITAAEKGEFVDLDNIPAMPKESNESTAATEVPLTHKHDNNVFDYLIEILTNQIKKVQEYSEQFIHNGDVNRANEFDSLLSDTQQDLDYVKSLQNRGFAPPKYHFRDDTFESIPIITQLRSGELELVIVQILDIAVKDVAPFIEWEMPFPHDDPIKGKTERQKPGVKFNQSFLVPITRKSKPFQRAVRTKAVKLFLVEKGGLLSSNKVIGKAMVKLAPLQTNCETRAVEQFLDGRNVTGKVEVKLRIRTPLDATESRVVTEKWIVIKHDQVVRPASRPTTKQDSPLKKSKVCVII